MLEYHERCIDAWQTRDILQESADAAAKKKADDEVKAKDSEAKKNADKKEKDRKKKVRMHIIGHHYQWWLL